jgi:glycosyltransferase involved in cell wall biosynthesis
MRVLHIISSGGMYGAEAVILNLSKMLQESGHASILGVFANSSQPNLDIHEAARDKGIESHLIACDGQIDLGVARRIRQLVTDTQVDVVHTHGYKADIYTYIALRQLNVPVVSTCHGWIDSNYWLKLYGGIDRWTLRRVAAVVAVSEDVAKRLLDSGVPQRKVHEIRNGIDLRPFTNAVPSLPNNSDPTAFFVGQISRLSHEKGVDIFIRAAALVLRSVPEARFFIAGEGPDRAELESLIAELGVGQSVVLLGRQRDMPGFYASLDLMASSSRQEGLSMAVLESLASSLPTIATPVGEVPTAIENGVTGLLTPVEDHEALATAIVSLLRDPDQRKRLGTAGRKRIETTFSAGRMANDYLVLYESVTSLKKATTSQKERA